MVQSDDDECQFQHFAYLTSSTELGIRTGYPHVSSWHVQMTIAYIIAHCSLFSIKQSDDLETDHDFLW